MAFRKTLVTMPYICEQHFLSPPQKFEDSLVDNMTENAALFVDLLTHAGGVDADKTEVFQYLNLVEAFYAYRPGRSFDGSAVAVKATDASDPLAAVINEVWPSYEKVLQHCFCEIRVICHVME